MINIINIAKSLLLDEKITIEDFRGMHTLSGVEFDGSDIIFVVDDIAFVAEEDPQDGYRSSLDSINVYRGTVKNTFQPVKVKCSVSGQILVFTDVVNNKEILRVGTDNWDDYYPCFVNEWTPENLSINEK